jgi:hypothetical protein
MLGSIAVRSFLRYLYAGHLNDRKTEERTGILCFAFTSSLVVAKI